MAAAFLGLAGRRRWRERVAELGRRVEAPSLRGRAAARRHEAELILARLAGANPGGSSEGERRVVAYAGEAVRLAAALPPESRERLRERVVAGLTGEESLIPLFHLLRLAAMQRARGFEVHFTGLVEGTPHDLVIARDGAEAEVVCETVSAEEGRPLQRGGWCALVDAMNPDLQTWLAAHPGRYVLKVTLPEGLRTTGTDVQVLHRRILDMLQAQRRQEQAADAILKLDPLVLAGAQSAVPAASLRAQFGPEAQLAVAQAGGNMLVLAARAGGGNDISRAVCQRLDGAVARLGGRRPGLVAIFLDDLDRAEWRGLRDRMELEGAVRRSLTTERLRPVTCVSCSSRAEMFGLAPPDAAAEGELRFRNPSHPGGRVAALASALVSTP
ncbi:hypothetical protein [Muricoccus radiodurans]|uniref:hypothetical protein n=1 Tax=Muricoccus radiodurans TaxID=2231721 RepID=UPI003CF00DD0